MVGAHEPVVRTRGSLPDFLASCPSLERVRGLGLGRVKLRKPELEALFTCTRLSQVSFLNLTQCGIGVAGSQAAVRAIELAALPALRRLALWGNNIGDKGCSALAASPFVARLKILALGKNKLGALGARALLDSPHLEQIEELSVVPNKIPDELQAALRERFGERIQLSYS